MCSADEETLPDSENPSPSSIVRAHSSGCTNGDNEADPLIVFLCRSPSASASPSVFLLSARGREIFQPARFTEQNEAPCLP